MLCGGHSNTKSCADNQEEKEMFEGLKAQIEEKASKTYGQFEAILFTSQVVAGCNYWVKFRTEDEFVHVKIFKPLPHTGNPPEIVEVHGGQTENAEFNH